MAEKHNIDSYGRSLITEKEICDYLYVNPTFDYSHIKLANSKKYNSAIDARYFDWHKLSSLDSIDITPEQWHDQNQNTWLMPQEYKNFDIVKWVLEQCKNETELQRCAEELLLYSERDLIGFLQYLKYFVDTMRTNSIVWGVGRGSSVASFVLYIIGVHRINSITYNLDIREFIR